MPLPYYVIPDIEALKTETDPEKLLVHRRRIAAIIGDPDARRALLGDASEDFHDFYGTSDLPTLSTDDTIDSFLKKFGKAGDTAEEKATVAESIVAVAPAVDYASMLESELAPLPTADGPQAADGTLGAIDSFLAGQAGRIRPKKEVKEEEKPSLTEGFAKIMIKNGNYRRALEIITQISLNNPEKSI
ncbi:MAG: hypothetical protein K2K93_01545, partial [Muribaculaceae bacterium]|nr:hypothetical protein [Muribaculaceae bacterium]